MSIRTSSMVRLTVPILVLATSACTAIFGMEEGELGAVDAGGDSSAGTGGMSGASGTGGTGGTGGDSGTSGGGTGGTSGGGTGGASGGGTGGAAGTSAAGGAAGEAGIGGSAGAAGTAGSAGEAGAAGAAGVGCPTDCNDGLSCTDDACAQGDCENTLAIGCLIEGGCVAEGELNPDNACEVCDSTRHEYQYSQVANGTDCGAGQVCNAGVCGDCVDGQACTPSEACRVGQIDCSSGSPVCQETGNLDNGTGCGVDMVCNNGSCESCEAGAACSPGVCRVGLTSCSTGVQVCQETGNAGNGSSCGTNMVCYNGACASCVEGQSCAPTNPCKLGAITCSSGQPQCVQTTNQPDGTTCGSSKICQSGTCVDSCNLTTHACVTPAGAGWSAPFAHVAASQGCQGQFPTQVGVLRNSLSVPSSTCDCTCGTPTGSCDPDVGVEGFSDSQSCTSSVGGGDIHPPTCFNLGTLSRKIIAPSIESSCASGTVTPYLSTPTWGLNHVACAPVAGLPCADSGDSCVPQPASPFSSEICVMRSGSVACPSGFPNRTVYYEDYNDTRSCPSSCTCTKSGGYCSVPITGYSGSGCTGSNQSINVTTELCLTNALYDSFHAGTPTVGSYGTCQATDPSVTGSASASDPITVCCL